MRALLQRPGRAAWAILAVALLVRVVLVAATADYVPYADPADYHRHGAAIAAGGYPPTLLPEGGETAYRPPGYPAFLGAVYALTGARWNVARLAQALVGTGTVALIGLLALQLAGRAAALGAMALAAVHPPLLAVGAALVAESIAVPVLIGATLAALRARRTRALRWAALAGLLAGAAVLTRANAAPAVPLLALLARPPGSGLGGLRAPAAVLVACVLAVAPWTARNALALERFVPVTTQAGPTLAGTYNDAARTGTLPPATRFPAQWVEWYRVPEYARIAAAGGGEVVVGARLRDAALEYARAHPGYVLDVLRHNLGRLLHAEAPFAFARYDAQAVGLPAWLGELEAIGWWLLVAAAAAGALLGGARGVPALVWLVPLSVLPSVLLAAYLRFRVGIDAFALVLAGVAAAAVATRVRRLSRR